MEDPGRKVHADEPAVTPASGRDGFFFLDWPPLLLLVPAPDVPAAIARELADELRAGSTGAAGASASMTRSSGRGPRRLVEAARASPRADRRRAPVCLTDVPLRTGKRPLIAALAPPRIGVVFGARHRGRLLRRRVKRTTEAVVAELAERDTAAPGRCARRRRAAGRRLGLNRGYVLPPGPGHVRLLAGMVRATGHGAP